MQPSINLRQAIEQRRAARAFKRDLIPSVILQEILRLGLQAPSGYNLQPWRFIVVRSLENKQKLRACASNQRQVEEAPVVLICCGDRRVNQSDYIESVIELGKSESAINDAYADFIRSSIPALFEKHTSFESLEAWINRQTMLAVAYLMMVAQSYGVDSCPMEGFVTTQVKEAFKIPEEVDVCCILAMGYAAEPFKQYGGRFSLQQVCYGETYGEVLEI
ncbi:nitroreductase family protein [Limnoraphis robusta]|uniref:NADH dehydrogenase n=2 Tax=Limnoraphis robusta TaxID=1118279 RepID=A0A0F5Y6R8_9CYAN|nr:nitroreductase family protein [Limnoraphis robusta]KKD34473.1 NADH dehydrogenase [Limnoraphis robusta CS-951]MEA5500858.1 nitroreductase family protein [Limnoraphis robusta BA-68 BA1]MEA5523099.1 nitroreductase family protein [Limnoraphis robusta CCNP1315]MEA5548087.1 nitroreductase family protein [Limnoraphis robusta CCNP1324]